MATAECALIKLKLPEVIISSYNIHINWHCLALSFVKPELPSSCLSLSLFILLSIFLPVCPSPAVHPVAFKFNFLLFPLGLPPIVCRLPSLCVCPLPRPFRHFHISKSKFNNHNNDSNKLSSIIHTQRVEGEPVLTSVVGVASGMCCKVRLARCSRHFMGECGPHAKWATCHIYIHGHCQQNQGDV